MAAIAFRGVKIEVANAAEAAALRINDFNEQAHIRAASYVPGGYWTSALAVLLVAQDGVTRGTITPARAASIIASAEAVWAAALAAESAIQEVLDGPGTEEEKVAAIDSIWPVWPNEEGE